MRKSTAADLKAACMRTVPGVGLITAAAVEAFTPALESFRRGSNFAHADFAAWLGLVLRQHSTGGKERLGRVSKMGHGLSRSRGNGACGKRIKPPAKTRILWYL